MKGEFSPGPIDKFIDFLENRQYYWNHFLNSIIPGRRERQNAEISKLFGSIDADLWRECDEEFISDDPCRKEIEHLQAELSKCREALRMVEWVTAPRYGTSWGTIKFCPWCENMNGHADNCPRQAALESAG